MATYGLTLLGLVIKSLPIIRAEIDAAVRGKIGNAPLGDRTLLGIYDGILADREASLWQLLQVLDSCFNPDKATGKSLDAICLLTGTLRPQASFSSDSLILGGDPSTSIPSGTQIKTASTAVVFQTTSTVVLSLAPTWAALTVYSIGDVITRSVSSTDTLFICLLAVSGSTAPESDGTHWLQVGNGTAFSLVNCLALLTGPSEAAAGDLSSIVSGISGWDTAYNQLDAQIGRNIATDEELRLLREAELAAPGTSPVDAIRSDLLQIAQVTTATVFENVGDTTNADGMPPHSIECLVQGGADQDIFNQLLKSVAAGIATFGNSGGLVTGTAIDSMEISHTMNFARPVLVPIYADIAVIYDARIFPADGFAQIQTAITDAGNARGAGYDAVSSSVVSACFSVVGVLDVSHAYISLAPAPTLATTIPVSNRELSTWAEIRITGTATPGTP